MSKSTAHRSRRHRPPAATPQPAIFLDRDGTLNFDYGWISVPEKIELLPGAGQAVREINLAGYLAVVVTNQPVIARGECSEAQLDAIHDRLEQLLAEENAKLDAIYYCPHHPDGGYPNQRPEFMMQCLCRKPAPGLILAAAQDLNIDLSRSWLIGDSTRDLGAAAAAGIPSVLVASNQRELKHHELFTPVWCTPSVLEATENVLRRTPR